MSRLPVVAAIPNYNMGEQLASLLPQLEEQEYDQIFVLDDASTDHSREIVEALGTRAIFVSSDVNKGAASARNNMVDRLSHKSIIHFLDADIDLQTEDVADVANDVMSRGEAGFVGGLIVDENGAQSQWNYGPRQSLYTAIGAQLVHRLPGIQEKNPKLARILESKYADWLSNWPDLSSPPERKQVFWAAEGNILIDSDVFNRFNGYNSDLRELEIQDLAMRMAKVGLPRFFDPSIRVQHLEVDVRGYNRRLEKKKAELAIARLYGIGNWVLPDGRLRPQL